MYKKPRILVTDDLAEGVYAASGDTFVDFPDISTPAPSEEYPDDPADSGYPYDSGDDTGGGDSEDTGGGSGTGETDSSDGCYTVSTSIHQTPETGRGDYRIQVNGIHNADHTRETQWLEISFNQPVIHKSGGTLVSGDGSTSLTICYNYHQNPFDNIGLGDLVVESETGLAVIGASITD